jgi:hypothetical protein
MLSASMPVMLKQRHETAAFSARRRGDPLPYASYGKGAVPLLTNIHTGLGCFIA